MQPHTMLSYLWVRVESEPFQCWFTLPYTRLAFIFARCSVANMQI